MMAAVLHRFRRVLFWACVVAAWTGSSRARATEQSVFLYSEGLAQYHEGHEEEALRLFQLAVERDPGDVVARYYRGVTLARRGAALDRPEQIEAGIADLREVVEKMPHLDQAKLELGIALVSAGRHEEALLWLHQAHVDPRLAAAASLHIGIAEIHLGEAQKSQGGEWFDRARAHLQEVLDLGAPPELALPAKYYLGVTEFRGKRYESAEDAFSEVVGEKPDTDMGREAQKFMDQIGSGRSLAYSIYASATLDYDSNAVLAPNDDSTRNALAISRQADGRSRIGVGASVIPLRTAELELSAGYDFGQTLYFNLTDFDLQEHRPYVALAARLGDWQTGFIGRYDYDLLQTTSFLQQVSVQPWVRFLEGEFGQTEAYYRLRWRDFFQRRYAPFLDAWNNAAGIAQTFFLGSSDRTLSIGYRFDRNQAVHADGDPFSYVGNEVDVGAGVAITPLDLRAQAYYRYRVEDFDDQSGGRRDHENAVSVGLYRPLTEHLELACEYVGTFHDSNQDVFAYRRNIVSIGVTARF